VYIVRLLFYKDTGAPIEQTEIDRAKGEREEIYQSFTANADPPVQVTSTWVTTTRGTVTEFEITMARLSYLLFQGRPTQ
jgi:hypothetical protein